MRVPAELPPFEQGKDAPTRAEQIVHWMESEVTVKEISYAPMWKWSPAARKKGADGVPFNAAKYRSDFYKRCKVYIYLRKGQPECGFTQLKDGFKQLEKLASAYLKQGEGAEAEAGEVDGEGGDEKRDKYWGEAAKVAQEMLG